MRDRREKNSINDVAVASFPAIVSAVGVVARALCAGENVQLGAGVETRAGGCSSVRIVARHWTRSSQPLPQLMRICGHIVTKILSCKDIGDYTYKNIL